MQITIKKPHFRLRVFCMLWHCGQWREAGTQFCRQHLKDCTTAMEREAAGDDDGAYKTGLYSFLKHEHCCKEGDHWCYNNRQPGSMFCERHTPIAEDLMAAELACKPT